MMEIAIYSEEEHYDMLMEWCKAHGWPGINRGLLSPLAYFARDGDELTAFAVLWPVHGTFVCLMEWIVSNPESSPMKVFKAIRTLTEFYEGIAVENGFGALITTCMQEKLAKLHERNGFERTDEGMIHLTKIIGD